MGMIFLFLLFGFFGLQAESITTLIDKPGTYVFRGDIIVEPTEENDAILTVSCGQVIIDLGGYMFTQTNTTQGLVGVRINADLDQVTVRNGRIVRLSGKGVEVQSGCSGVQLKGLEILHCQDRGISIEGIADNGINLAQIENCIVASTKGSADSPAFGLWGTNILSLLVDNSKFVGNDAVYTNSGFGCFLSSCTGLSFQNNIVSGNAGFERGVGLCLRHCDNLFVRDTLFNGNVAYSPFPSAKAMGAEFLSCNECQLLNCEFVKNTSPFAQAIGLRIKQGEENFLGNSHVQVNKGGISVVGVELENVKDCRIGCCRVTGNTGGTLAHGIKLIGTCQHCYIDNNEIINNSAATSYGILDEAYPSQNVIISNRAFNQRINYSVVYPVGILLPLVDASLTNTAIGFKAQVSGAFDNFNILH